jgi:hypothetical protein
MTNTLAYHKRELIKVLWVRFPEARGELLEMFGKVFLALLKKSSTHHEFGKIWPKLAIKKN